VDPTESEVIEWDGANEEHLARHRIGLWDVESVIETAIVCIPNRRSRAGAWKVIGTDPGGRVLSIVCDYDPTRRSIRPITGWVTTASERTKYLKGRRS
jgi:hypothetical protein